MLPVLNWLKEEHLVPEACLRDAWPCVEKKTNSLLDLGLELNNTLKPLVFSTNIEPAASSYPQPTWVFQSWKETCKKKSKNLIVTILYLIEEPLGELLKTLSTHKALFVVQFSVTVYYLLGRGETTLAALTDGVGQRIGHVAKKRKTA